MRPGVRRRSACPSVRERQTTDRRASCPAQASSASGGSIIGPRSRVRPSEGRFFALDFGLRAALFRRLDFFFAAGLFRVVLRLLEAIFFRATIPAVRLVAGFLVLRLAAF